MILISEPIALVGLAFAHRCQLESHPTYAQSPLIKLEVAGLMLAFLVVLVALVRAFSFLMGGEQAAVNGVVAFLTVGLSFLAMIVDAPTLVYGT